jgi:FAD dependent oxidoreductase
MIKKLTAILLICNCSLLYAQTIKTDVLVIGGSASGVAAAVQCARSKVKTILAVKDTTFGNFGSGGTMSVETNRDLPPGIWGEFRKYIHDLYKNTPGYDTAYNAALRFEPDKAASLLKNLADTTKNLTVYINAAFTTIKKDGDKWEVSLTENGQAVKIIARVVVDATENGDVIVKAGAQFTAGFDNTKNNSQLKTYRTSIASGEALPGQHYNDANAPKSNYPPYPAYSIPMSSVLVNGVDNLLVTEKALAGNKDIQYLPLQLNLGQGVGAVAAYCAFFKTTTKNLKVRIIQGELLDFKAYLLPFTDIPQKDRDCRAIQQVCETGLLRGVQQVTDNKTQFLFRPDSIVSTSEVQPVLTEIYTRAFLWFGKEKPEEKFTLGNLLSFISDYTLTDPIVLKARIQKEWKVLYKFEPYFDLNRAVTRREFAVLANKFLNPFARTVDLNGAMVN